MKWNHEFGSGMPLNPPESAILHISRICTISAESLHRLLTKFLKVFFFS